MTFVAKLQPAQSDPRREFAVEVVRKLRDAGHQALWAGGCVRDQLLGLQPKDYDVATSATPPEVREVFGRRRTLEIGVSFGVISVMGKRSQGHIEIATFREDQGYSDGRRPDAVKFSSAEEDAKRRDFTINGIFYDPLNDEVIDYVGGQQDLADRLIRAIGHAEDRIAEDKLRMLRGVRFAATYEFDIEPATLEAIELHADWLSQVSRERIAAEVHRMFSHRNRGLAIRYLVESGLARPVFDCQFFDLVKVYRSVELVGLLESECFATAMAAFLLPLVELDLDERRHEKLLRTTLHDWKYSNDETQAVVWLLKSCPVLLQAGPSTWPPVQRCLVHPLGSELLRLAEAVSSFENDRFRDALDYCRRQMQLPPEELNPEPLLDGRDLINAGYRPGPAFKETLETIRDLQLDGQLQTRAEALAHAEQLLGPKK